MKQKLSLVVSCTFLIIFLTLLTSVPAYAQQVTMAPYLPLEPGNWWQYRENGTKTCVEKVLAKQVFINTTPTNAIQTPEGIFYVTNDSLGIRIHRMKDYASGGTITFTPPLVSSPPLATLGQSTNSNGTARLYYPLYGTFDLAYSASSLLSNLEQISIPYGNFASVKIKTTLRIFGSIYGSRYDESSTEYAWYVKNIGRVKEITYDAGKVNEKILIDTNLTITKPTLSPIYLLLLKR